MSVRPSTRVGLLAVALVALTAGCGGDDPAGEALPGAAAPEPTRSSEPSPAGPAAAAAPPAASPPAASPPAAEGTSVPLLEGVVGSSEDPEAFEIVLADSSGTPVETLPAGAYDIRVQDLATLHNFHLTGPGVDEATPVPGTGEVVWRVTFTPGEYTAVCDPHPDMVTSFAVS